MNMYTHLMIHLLLLLLFCNKIVEVLIEAPSDKNGKYMGYTDTMKLVNVDCDSKYLGKIVKVKIESIKTWSMDGVVVNDK